ncbi:N-acyl-D-amino-acid deacylase [Prauserella marina]|uniref:N-acyl-D-amino-acid deacylase n=1 Tax=Prauserella marina TaxID=530584 RepID=A0A222VZ72_9PSEU|nr:D-aminoacylase [Prauserella marina]ASR39246.1 N-acyl-D-amino-acid deacylase [Prauserella marina]PWV84274.1 N-acyl-D-amino-acid deacylase [Prauserella marina]SDC26482.1 N-acyl-D-amino-acid deacylase [Prauserella marina]
MTEHEIVIRGGEIIDGSGAPRRSADIGITGDRITGIGKGLRGAETVDAGGLVVAPGFIDLHSHADFTLEGSPHATTQLHQGVTTLLTGNCGFSPFPVVGGLPPRLPVHGHELSWTWKDAAGFGKALERARPAVNVGLQIGHGAVRHAVLGGEDRPPSTDELDHMRQLVADAARGGALGLSSGLIYAPGLFGGMDEIAELARVAARHGMLYSTHMRDETDRLVEAVTEAIQTAERAGVRLEISHLKCMGRANHGSVNEALRLIEAARERGVDVGADVYPYTASSTGLMSRLAPWAVDGGADALLARLADPATRDRIAADLRDRFAAEHDPAGIVLAELSPGRYADAVGRSLQDLATGSAGDAADVALDVLAEHEARVGIVNHAMAEADVEAVLRHPAVAVASDGWTMDASGQGMPHPRSFGTFSRVLGRYVRERGVLTLEEAIRKMTSLPAERLRLADRGLLRDGAAADIVVFDPETVLDRSTYLDPWRLSEGMHAVLLNGVPVLRDGAPTGARGGRILGRA